MADDETELLSIGEFAARTWLTPKALRIYDRSGLLRGADLSLAAIESVIAELAGDTESACAPLEVLLDGIERGHQARRLVIRHV